MSDNPAISVRGLGKHYVLGGAERADESFREMLTGALIEPFRRLRRLRGERSEDEGFWALKDIDFDVHPGDVVGVIGRNGAGKSTLLKVLSRITDPSEGRVEIRGRVSSLLEVGTGFHPELTGRENIFLNGAILGMSRFEIQKKFDEIVAFAEVEKFLDTPVKRYSSGMYVRLAFAVAAHLEPEILIVDEVLAVGDAAFQKKCLGKMGDVSKEGRTVLFVSHNMGAVRTLCSRAILLNKGSLVVDTKTDLAVDEYLSAGQVTGASEIHWPEESGPACEELMLSSIRLLGAEGKVHTVYDATKPVTVEIKYQVKKPVRGMRMVMSVLTSQGEVAFSTTNHAASGEREFKPGVYYTKCHIMADLFNNGSYVLNIQVGLPGVKIMIPAQDYLSFMVEGSGGHGSVFPERWAGVVAPKLSWEIVDESNPR